MFDLDRISCTHTIATCRYENKLCYIMCSQYYMNSLISSYSISIYSTRNNKDWVIPKYICYKVVLPPKSQQLVGRPKNERI